LSLGEDYFHYIRQYLSPNAHLNFEAPLALARPENLNSNCEYIPKESRAQAIPKEKSINSSDIQKCYINVSALLFNKILYPTLRDTVKKKT
jgi:hypothetical protein